MSYRRPYSSFQPLPCVTQTENPRLTVSLHPVDRRLYATPHRTAPLRPAVSFAGGRRAAAAGTRPPGPTTPTHLHDLALALLALGFRVRISVVVERRTTNSAVSTGCNHLPPRLSETPLRTAEEGTRTEPPLPQ
jgi:hypothetical protein